MNGYENVNVPKVNWDNMETISQFDSQDINMVEIDSPHLPITAANVQADNINQTNYNQDLRPPPSTTNFRNAISNLAECHSTATASTSLLIESLIQLLCLILEDDPSIAQKSYKSICEQLNRINLIDNSYLMNEFEEIRSQYQMQIYKIICAVREQDIPISLPNNLNKNDSNNSMSINKSQSVETCWSRYHREFDEISFIAGGGFGKVFKARHKLDDIEYAVKQIKIHSTTIKLCHLAEVKTIASLNHPNVVQYKAAWLEPYLPNARNSKNRNSNNDMEAILSSDTNDNEDDDGNRKQKLSNISKNNRKKSTESIETETDGNVNNKNEHRKSIDRDNNNENIDILEHLKIEFSDDEDDVNRKRFEYNNESSDFIQFERTRSKNKNCNKHEIESEPVKLNAKFKKKNPINSSSDTDSYDSSCSNGHNYNDKLICKYNSENNKNASSNLTTENNENYRYKPKLAILYIQMSLCQLTLRKWLNERNSYKTFDEYYIDFFNNTTIDINNKSERDEIILNHFDIVNDIFSQILSGLNYIHSRNIVHHDIKPSNIFLGIENDGKLTVQLGDFGLACPLQNGHHSIALGTPLYAAPEQLNGECNPKSDIYSLGIVLLELLLKFKTDMERIRTIEDARKGILPLELSKHSIKLLRSLLSSEKSRPNTKELLDVIRALNLEKNLQTLNTKTIDIKLKDSKINELKEEINALHLKYIEKENEISNLLTEINKLNKKIDELMNLLKIKDNEINKLKNTINELTVIIK